MEKSSESNFSNVSGQNARARNDDIQRIKFKFSKELLNNIDEMFVLTKHLSKSLIRNLAELFVSDEYLFKVKSYYNTARRTTYITYFSNDLMLKLMTALRTSDIDTFKRIVFDYGHESSNG